MCDAVNIFEEITDISDVDNIIGRVFQSGLHAATCFVDLSNEAVRERPHRTGRYGCGNGASLSSESILHTISLESKEEEYHSLVVFTRREDSWGVCVGSATL